MNGRTRTLRTVLVACLCAASLLVTAGIAFGAPAILLERGEGSSPTGGTVEAFCTGQLGAATDFNRITYAVEAVANAAHSKIGVAPVGTGIVCRIVNASTGAVYGTVRGGAPGSTAVAAGTISFPRTAAVRACVEASAVYSDGSTAAFDGC